MILNKSNLAALNTGYKAAFNTGFRSVTPTWQQVATKVSSSTKVEKYAWLGQFPKLREWIGERVLKSITAHDYSITNRKFESTVSVPRDDIDDDTYGVFTPLFQEMGHAAAIHPDELVFELLQAGFTELCYDGQPFFDADHPVGEGDKVKSVSNVQVGGAAPWFLLDTSRPLRPLIYQERRAYDLKVMDDLRDEVVFTRDALRYGVDGRCAVGFGFWQQAFASKAALDTENFNAAYAAMLAFKSDEGRPLGLKPTLLVVGATNRAAALEVVKAERLANGATNTNRDVVEVLVSPLLD